MIRIVIADDHVYTRAGIRLLLQDVKGYEVVAEAANGEELLRAVEQYRPDVVITDIEMPAPDGVEATSIIKQRYPETGVLALTMYEDEHLLVDMLEAGASGYLLKRTNQQELIDAIETASRGGNYFCKDTSIRLTKMIANSRAKVVADEVPDFSEKELAIIQLICQQYVSKEIAGRVDLTERTVEKYRNAIIHRIGARNQVGIVVYAIKHKLFIP